MARQRLGQHFLIRGSTLERIAHAACPEPELLVIEIGPGRGALTAVLLRRAARVIAIELDGALAQHLRQRFAGENLEIAEADALKIDLAQWGPAVIAGNLPYYAATAIIQRTLELGPALRRAVFLVQKEVAERVAAGPGSRAYGYLSVAVQLCADVRSLFEVKPAAFRPPPKVDSAVVCLHPRRRAAELGIADPRDFLRFVAMCFHQKRKTIRNNLAAHFDVAGYAEAGLRAEQLSIEQLNSLYQRIHAAPVESA